MYKVDEEFENIDFGSQNSTGGEFEACAFTNCVFLNADLSGRFLSTAGSSAAT